MQSASGAGPAGAAPRYALTTLTGGGFTFETTRLLDSLKDDMSFIYLATAEGGMPGENGIPPGPRHPIPKFATITRTSRWISVRAFLGTWGTALRVLRRQRADLVVVVGSSHAVPVFLAARMLGHPTTYIESVTRVDKLSNTGKIVYRLRLADTFIVQWAGLQRAYPAAQLGTIL